MLYNEWSYYFSVLFGHSQPADLLMPRVKLHKSIPKRQEWFFSALVTGYKLKKKIKLLRAGSVLVSFNHFWFTTEVKSFHF